MRCFGALLRSNTVQEAVDVLAAVADEDFADPWVRQAVALCRRVVGDGVVPAASVLLARLSHEHGLHQHRLMRVLAAVADDQPAAVGGHTWPRLSLNLPVGITKDLLVGFVAARRLASDAENNPCSRLNKVLRRADDQRAIVSLRSPLESLEGIEIAAQDSWSRASGFGNSANNTCVVTVIILDQGAARPSATLRTGSQPR